MQVFCQRHRTSPHSFYKWRRRLAEQVPVKFALVKTDRGEPCKGLRRWNSPLSRGSGCGLRQALMPPRSAWSLAYCASGDDPSAGERARVSGDITL